MTATLPSLSNLKPNPAWGSLPLFDRTGWKRMAFGEFAESIGERAEPRDAQEEIYVGLEHLDPQCLHIRRWGKGSDVIGGKLRFHKGDIIFGKRRAYQRKLAVAEFGGICSAHAMVVRARPDKVLPEFLPFLMMSDRFMNRAVEISVGSLSPTINWTTLKLETFDLPPLDQQRRIAEILWAVDVVVGRDEELDEAVATAKAMWMSEQIPAEPRTGRIRSEVVLKGNGRWSPGRLGDFAKTLGGSGFPHAYQGQKAGSLPFYKVSDMNTPGNELIMRRAENYIDLKQRQELKARIVPANAVVFPKVGAALLTNKRRLTSVECCIDNNMMAVISDSVPPDYLLEFLNRIDFASIVQMGAVPSVNQSQVEALDFPALRQSEHAAFAAELQKYDALKHSTAAHVSRSQQVLQNLTASIFQ